MEHSEAKQGKGAAEAGEGFAADTVWICVQAKPGQPVRAKSELVRQGFPVYLPMQLFERKGVVCSKPFLMNYLFARVPQRVDDWREIFSTYGVAGVLGCSLSQGRVSAVKDKFVQRIKDREDGGYIRLGLAEDAAERGFEAGQRVVLDDLVDALVMERVDARRVMILVSGLFGRDSVHTVDIKRLAEATAKPQTN